MNKGLGRRAVIASTIALCAISCTELEVRKLVATDSKWADREGIAYSLQFHQFKIDVTRGIASCEKEVPQIPVPDSPEPPTVPDVKAFVKAKITAELVDDGDHTYVIDPNSLRGMTKITNVTVEWKDGRLIGINASADDQTGEVISSVASGILKLAISAIKPESLMAVSGGVRKKLVDKNIIRCKKDILESVKAYKTNSGLIEGTTKELSKLAEEMQKEEIRLEKLGDSSAADCSKSTNKDHPRCVLQQLLTSQKSAESILKKATKDLESALKKISYTEPYRWPVNSLTSISEVKSIDDAQLKKWIVQSSVKLDKDESIPDKLQSPAQFKPEFDVVFRIGKIGSYGKANAKESQDPGAASDGLRYRLPANGYVAVCKNLQQGIKDKCTRDADKELLVAKLESPLQQLGHIFHIPFDSKAFTKGNVELKFDKQGRLEKASVAETESSGENIAKAFQGVVDEYVKYRAVAEAEDETELSMLQEQTALLKAQKELQDAQKALDPEVLPLTELQNKIALAQAQKQYMDALAALEPDDPPSADEEELAILSSEVLLLQAEIARLEALLRRQELEEALNP